MKTQIWHGKTAYQIYPKSFCDSNGDGIGDIAGIISKLDYLEWLGIDLLWLSPIYESPFIDQGYDISNYYRIAPEFGTMEDFDRLLAEAKRRNIGIVMDLVVNHCSDKHEWFQKALADPTGPYADYFYFRRGKGGRPPSNYRSYFGGSAWEPVPGTDLYYLHFFAKEQPDLNWENPALREEIYTMVNWWLDRGLAGFRIDAIMNIKKDTAFPDYPADGRDGLVRASTMIHHVEGIDAFLSELRDRCFSPHGAFTVGEVFDIEAEATRRFIGSEGFFSTMFDFSQHLLFGSGEYGWYDAPSFDFDIWKKTLFHSQLLAQNENCFYANVIENHDEPRGSCTYLPAWAMEDENLWLRGIKALGLINVSLRGIPFIYQGQELGMRNCPFDSIADYDDIGTRDQYQLARESGMSDKDALAVCFRHSRDNARTPFQWDGSANAGFSSGTPWLKVNPNYTRINMDAQRTDPRSVLSWYRALIILRSSSEYADVFAEGLFAPAYEDEAGLIAFTRTSGERLILAAANFGQDEVRLSLPAPLASVKMMLGDVSVEEGGVLVLKPLDSCIIGSEEIGVSLQ